MLAATRPRALHLAYSLDARATGLPVPSARCSTGPVGRGEFGPSLEAIGAEWDDELRDGIVQLAFLARLTRAAVVEMTRRPEMVEVLEKLAEDGVLVQRDGGTPTAWRFEPRFRVHLQELAYNALTPHHLVDLLRRTTR